VRNHEYAKKYGGGGHPNASGFELSYKDFCFKFLVAKWD